MKRTLLACLLIVGVAAAADAGMKVESKNLENLQLSGSESYAWRAGDKPESGLLIAEGTKLAKLVESTGDEVLAASGLTRSVNGTVDLVIRYRAASSDNLSIEGTTRDLGGNVSWEGDPYAHSVTSFSRGTLLLEVLAADGEKLLWMGWASDVMELAPKPAKLEKVTEKAVRKILKTLPID